MQSPPGKGGRRVRRNSCFTRSARAGFPLLNAHPIPVCRSDEHFPAFAVIAFHPECGRIRREEAFSWTQEKYNGDKSVETMEHPGCVRTQGHEHQKCAAPTEYGAPCR